MILGGQHTPFWGGQHAPFWGGQLKPILGGQYERFFSLGLIGGQITFDRYERGGSVILKIPYNDDNK